MKVNELFEAREPVKGNWKIQNLVGVFKTFKDPHSPEARAWMTNRELPYDREARRREREWDKIDRAAEREERRRAKMKPSADEIHRRVENAVSVTFPDGDPIDYVSSWMDQNNVTMDDVDKAFKKIERKTYHRYLGDMWEGLARDSLYDAKRHYNKHGDEPHDPHNGLFWEMGKNGPELNDNPWWTRDEQKKYRAKYKD